MTIQRYDMVSGLDGCVYGEKDPEGEWVRFEDLPKWQPIETAPKDGTKLLLIESHEVPCVGSWWSDAWRVDGSCAERRPTHWMPILEPPESP